MKLLPYLYLPLALCASVTVTRVPDHQTSITQTSLPVLSALDALELSATRTPLGGDQEADVPFSRRIFGYAVVGIGLFYFVFVVLFFAWMRWDLVQRRKELPPDVLTEQDYLEALRQGKTIEYLGESSDSDCESDSKSVPSSVSDGESHRRPTKALPASARSSPPNTNGTRWRDPVATRPR